MTRRATREPVVSDAKRLTKQFGQAKVKPTDWLIRHYFGIGEKP